MKLKDLSFDVKKTVDGKLLLVEKPTEYEGYKDGVKTGSEGLRYTVLCEKLNFDKITIKIPGKLTPSIVYEGTPVPVSFEGLEGKVWQDFNNHGEIKLSLTATDIKVAGEKHIKVNNGGNRE